MNRAIKFIVGSFGSFLDFTPRSNLNSEYIKYVESQTDAEAIQSYWLEVGDCLRFAMNQFEEENVEEIQGAIKKQQAPPTENKSFPF